MGRGAIEAPSCRDLSCGGASSRRQLRTEEISPLVRQDVLLLAGAEDHYIPAHQVYDQAARPTNARSVTTRMFSRAESTQAHCQIGNLPLAIQTVTDWLDQRLNTAAG